MPPVSSGRSKLSSDTDTRISVDCLWPPRFFFFFFLNDPATPEISPLPHPAAFPICVMGMRPGQLYLIQGPPGTGKTTAIVESIRRILSRNPSASILLSSHSNDAVDTGQERLLGLDRKSTRLNSSHSQISYAAFCLKK